MRNIISVIFFCCCTITSIAQKIQLKQFTNYSLDIEFVKDIKFDQNNLLYLNTSSGLMTFNGQKKTFLTDKLVESYIIGDTLIYSTYDGQIVSRYQNNFTELYNSNYGVKGLLKFDKSIITSTSNALLRISGDKVDEIKLDIEYIQSILKFDENKVLVVGDYLILKVNLKNQEVDTFFISEHPISWVRLNNTTREIYLGTQKSISIIDETGHIFKIFNISNANDICEFDSDFWVATNKGLIVFSNNKKKKIENEILVRKSIKQIVPNGAGNMFLLLPNHGVLGCKNNKLFSYPKETFPDKKWKFKNDTFELRNSGLYKIINGEKELFINQEIDECYIRNDYFIFCNNSGIYRCHIVKKKVTQISNGRYRDLIFLKDNIYAITNKGLATIKDYKYVDFIDISKGLSHNKLNDIELIRDTLYLATESGGYDLIVNDKYLNSYKLNSSNFEIEFIKYDSILNQIYYISNYNGIWIETSDKLRKIPIPEAIQEVVLWQGDLMIMGQTAVYRITKNGHDLLWNINNERSLLKNSFFNSDEDLILSLSDHQLLINQHLSLKSVSSSSFCSVKIDGQRMPKLDREFILDPGKHTINVSVSEVNYFKRTKKVYYKIVGALNNSDWILMENNQMSLELNQPGEFEVIIKFEDEESPISLQFYCRNYFYKTYLFWILSISFIFLSSLFLYKMRLRKIEKEKMFLEKQVEARTKDIRNQKEELELIAQLISHDVKIPANNIFNLSKLLINKPDKQKDEVAHVLMNSSKFLSNHVIGLLEYLKTFRNPILEKVNLGEIIQEIKPNLKDLVDSNDVQIKLDLNNEELYTSHAFLSSILFNVISNGIKYSDEKKKSFIELKVEAKKDIIIISIEDNGVGMSEGQVKKIFDPYTRFSTNRHGTGLGMYGVKKLVDQIGGDLNIFSELGRGTIVLIILPKKFKHGLIG